MTVDLGLFLALSFAVIVIPGPNVMVIIATSLSHGRQRGLQTVAGTSVAMLFQLLVAGVGTGLIVETLTTGLLWLKWAGVAYLFYLGISRLLGLSGSSGSNLNGQVSFNRGFWVSLTNPKTILFFSAFLPQFVSPGGSYATQIVLLSLLFWGMAVILDSSYALLAAQLRGRLQSVKSGATWSRLGGLVYLGAGLTLAANRQT